ncbi:MAG: adenosylcobinamide-GDP ribazoletransferase [Deltaproteobacteria bacterium]|nr:adenosylcobinamide-GDP ribazoletransferase [Deltaproteobacteria bacterium]
MKSLLTAFRTLTIIPWPGKESKDFASSLPWFPVVGLVLGLILYAIAFLWVKQPFAQWPAGGALTLLFVHISLTRGLHQDGLADWADSMGGMFNREKRLEIMKDSSVGAFGVIALILVLAAKWAAIERIISSGSIIWLLPLPIISRSMMVELITILPYARTGNGMGRRFVEGSSMRHRILSHIICLIFCLFFGPLGLLLWLSAMILTGIFGRRCLKTFGGITGDLMGAANELIETALLFICAFPGSGIMSYKGWAWIF